MEEVIRLKKLALEHLKSNLDDHAPNYIPPDLKEGSYRWLLYLYSNMYERGKDYISDSERLLFISIASKLRTEHLISWTRKELFQIDDDKIKDLLDFLNSKIESTNSFYELKVCLYLKSTIEKNFFQVCYIIDDYMMDVLPELKKYVV